MSGISAVSAITSIDPAIVSSQIMANQSLQAQAAQGMPGLNANGIHTGASHSTRGVSDSVWADGALAKRNLNSLGDNLTKDVGRFFNKMASLETGGRARLNSSALDPSQRRDSVSGLASDGVEQDGKLERGIEAYRSAAEYSMYLSATASIVQLGVGSFKRLQQG